MKQNGAIVLFVTLALLSGGRSYGDDVSYVAGVLNEGNGFTVEYAFDGSDGEVLFAIIEDIYQTRGRSSHTGDDHTVTTEAVHDSGSECGCDDEGGPGGFSLQVLDGDGNKICWAGRPMRPGWNRDPRLVCPFDEDDEYTLRVTRQGSGGGCEETLASEAPEGAADMPFLLSVHFMWRSASGGTLKEAIELNSGRPER